MRGGAAQVGVTFSSLSQAYAQSATQAAQATRDASATQLAIAREQANAQYQIALDGVKMQEALVKEQTQTSQISQQQQLQSLLALEDQRAALERQHLQSVEASYAEESSGYLRAQQRLEEADAESARRREQIELTYNREIYADYRRTFDQIGSSVSTSIMGMIEGHESLRQAAQRVLLSDHSGFHPGTHPHGRRLARRRGDRDDRRAGRSDGADRRGDDGRRCAHVGAAGRRVCGTCGQCLVDDQPDFGIGARDICWRLRISRADSGPGRDRTRRGGGRHGRGGGELCGWLLGTAVRHARQCASRRNDRAGERDAMGAERVGGRGRLAARGGVTVNHATHFNVSALDSQDVSRWFKNNSKMMLRTINEAVRHGSHLGLDKLRSQG